MRRHLGSNAIPLFIIAALVAVNAVRSVLGVSTHRTRTTEGYCEGHRVALKPGFVPFAPGCPREITPMERSSYPNAATSADRFDPGWEETINIPLPDHDGLLYDLPFPQYGEVWYCPECRRAEEHYRRSRER